MADVGKYNRLKVVKELDFGLYLDGEELGEILLPRRYIPEGTQVDDLLDVFIYLDSEDMLIATTEKPRVTVGECAYLKVVAKSRIGVFLDWGLPKDLLLPYAEQHRPLKVGDSETVCLYIDNSGRIAASAKLRKFLREESEDFRPRQPVDLTICARTDLGYKAIINSTHLGVIYKNEVFQPLRYGQKLKGFIKAIRPDGKIDLCLQLQNQDARDELSARIVEYLERRGGTSTLTDKSPAEAIYKAFGVSKANYKRALGRLYKERKILIEKEKITLL